MSNDPKAGQGIDAELLAAYLDQRLSPEQRAAVEAQLASDPESYELFVESIRVKDAVDASAAVATSLKPARQPGAWYWPIGLAAAATLFVLIFVAPEAWRRWQGSEQNPQLEKLVAAVGNERYIEARLTGGFAFGPLRSPNRSGAKPNLAVIAAAGELQAAAQANPTSETFGNWGVAALHVGQWDDAVTALEQSVGLAPNNAHLQANLSAAYLTRAQQLDRPDDLPKGLAAAERALKADDRLLEAHFNRALALELLHLSEQAQKAWEDYAARDSSEWGSLARTKAARKIAGDPDAIWRAGFTALRADSQLESLVARFPENAFRSSEVDWPNAWAEAVLRDDHAEATLTHNRLAIVGATLQRVTTDGLIHDLATFLRSLPPQDRREVASDLTAYRHGREALDNYLFGDAARILSDAVKRMNETRNPLSVLAALDYASALRSARQINAASQLLPSLRSAAVPYPVIRARLHRLSGLVNLGSGKYAEALEEYSAAKNEFASIGFHKSMTLTNTLIAEALAQLGSRDIWRYHAETLRLLDSGVSPRDQQSITFTAGFLALNQGFPEAAVHFFTAMVSAAESVGVPGALAEARLNRARALLAIDDSDDFKVELQTANALIDRLPTGPNRDFLRGEWASVRAEWLSRTRPAEALEATEQALEYAEQKNRLSLIPRLHLARGRALVALKRDSEAEYALQTGITAFESLWRTVNQDALRVSHFDLTWDLYGELVGVQMRIGKPIAALATLERSQGRSLLAARARQILDWDVHRMEAALRPSVAVVYFMPSSDVTYAWVVRATGTQDFALPIRRSEIERIARLPVESVKQLGHRLLTPLTKAISEATAIGIVAPGLLSQIPWAAVEMEPGKVLTDSATVQLLPSGSFLSLPKATSRGFRTLVVASGKRVRDGVTELPELPGAREEASAVAQLYDDATVLLDEHARADVVLKDLQTHDIFHFAGHAVANESLPHMSRLLLPAGSISSRQLAMVDDVKVRLAVLTACSTASGAVARSEGAVSISWLLLARGVDSVIATLHPVSDRAASKFGVAFHAALRRGASAADSLRHAQRAVRESQLADSREWSDFILVGAADQLVDGGF